MSATVEAEVAKEHGSSMYSFINDVLTTIGPRESCSENERQLGNWLKERWENQGHRAHLERFECHPQAFLGCLPYVSMLYYVSFWYLHQNSPLEAAIFSGLACAVVLFENVLYFQFVDPLFPKRAGFNVVAKIAPAQEVRQRVVLSAHQDSAYEFNIWLWFKDAGVVVMVLSLGAAVVPFVGSLASLLTGQEYVFLYYLAAALIPFASLNFVFHTKNVVPGAMDNLAGLSVLDAVSSHFSSAKLQNTEIILLATSSEEAGLRGAKSYVLVHKEELVNSDVSTFGIFVDGVYDERHLRIVTRELCVLAKHSEVRSCWCDREITKDQDLINVAQSVAKSNRLQVRKCVIPFGASDAAAFSIAGVPSLCLLCQDTTRLACNYHTRYDTIDRVRPEALVVSLQMTLGMLAALDVGANAKQH